MILAWAGIIIGILALGFLLDMGIAWLVTKGLMLAFGVEVSYWGIFLLLLAIQLFVGLIRGHKNG